MRAMKQKRSCHVLLTSDGCESMLPMAIDCKTMETTLGSGRALDQSALSAWPKLLSSRALFRIPKHSTQELPRCKIPRRDQPAALRLNHVFAESVLAQRRWIVLLKAKFSLAVSKGEPQHRFSLARAMGIAVYGGKQLCSDIFHARLWSDSFESLLGLLGAALKVV
jgi:hypothetical protein